MILISVGLLFRETSSFDLLCCQVRSEHNSLIVFNRLLVLISPFTYNHKDVPPELSMFPSSRHILAIFVVINCTHFLHLFRMPPPFGTYTLYFPFSRAKLGSECLLVLPPQPSCIHLRQIHIKNYFHPPQQTHHSLAGFFMSMYWHLHPNNQRIYIFLSTISGM